MEYRKMENLGISTSLLGFGCMRFPTNADGSIDEEEAHDRPGVPGGGHIL